MIDLLSFPHPFPPPNGNPACGSVPCLPSPLPSLLSFWWRRVCQHPCPHFNLVLSFFFRCFKVSLRLMYPWRWRAPGQSSLFHFHFLLPTEIHNVVLPIVPCPATSTAFSVLQHFVNFFIPLFFAFSFPFRLTTEIFRSVLQQIHPYPIHITSNPTSFL